MHVIITGATKGIGLAITRAFAKEADSISICSRNAGALESLQKELKQKFPLCAVHIFPIDISVKENAIAFGRWALQNGKPDVLVNNAGTYLPGNVLNEADNTLENLLALNLNGPYYISRTIGNEMKKNNSGHIFNIGSIAGQMPYENGGSYSISKYALHGLSENLRHELKNFDVKVTLVVPGAVMTDSWEGFDNSTQRIMEADDIAAMVLQCTKLSKQAVVEKIVLRPQKGDL